MIAKNELRLGNIVGFVMESNLCYVSVIDEEGFITTTGLSNNRGEYNAERGEEDMMPIPLTPEILEKVGFKKTGSLKFNYTTYHLLDNDCWLVNVGFELDETIWGYFIQVSANKPEWLQLAEIKYVHQLQNLYFALTGEELEINL